MEFTNMGWHNVIDGGGIPLSIMGMSIVFVALAIIAATTGFMPYLLVFVAKIFPEKEIEKTSNNNKISVTINPETVAAIGFAHHHNSSSKR